MGNPATHRARKRFGQHFLHDRNVIERILRVIDPQPEDRLLEIGPGRGALTWPLLERCDRLTVIELDRDLAPMLEREAGGRGELEVINADILTFDLSAIADGRKFRLVGNLPYNISTPLMFRLLGFAELITDMHFMVQKEVAQRIVAAAGEDHYGRLSVMLQASCDCDRLFDVAPGCFRPPPKVQSSVIRLRPLDPPRADLGDAANFSAVVQAAFGQRRKTVANSLKSLIDRDTIIDCGIDPGLRAENLGIAEFAKLSNTLTS